MIRPPGEIHLPLRGRQRWSLRLLARTTGEPKSAPNIGEREPALQPPSRSCRDGQSSKVRYRDLIVPPWMYWMTMLVLAQRGLHGGQTDPSLVPSMFAPESTPAHAISHLASFALVITTAIFVVVASLLIYALVRFRRRANDDGIEPAQVYGSGPVEAAWTTVPFLIVL